MRRPWQPQAKADFRPWKPDVCQEPGCDEPHPSFSRDGKDGPWRCALHDSTASRRPDPTAPPPNPQDRLL